MIVGICFVVLLAVGMPIGFAIGLAGVISVGCASYSRPFHHGCDLQACQVLSIVHVLQLLFVHIRYCDRIIPLLLCEGLERGVKYHLLNKIIIRG